ncbi:TPA: P-type conjugative transfer protein TrbL [Acinetobacter baumannii]|nr:P-type conjugative transfer protein TrbL [Acinetobacter haemolyticus]OCY82074.1 P-type conjugative transfer protein TrbL [Acinetobacter pittii]PCN75386.1 conjugal transfer protein TrbL [Acinetobacter baumannii]PZM05937.1 P-type conjugative transfer protein TrbL [Acinetobacter nosocomialis]QBK71563.1 P-type conjugative transfer protein TrbL [Acinetobacter johnsonii]
MKLNIEIQMKKLKKIGLIETSLILILRSMNQRGSNMILPVVNKSLKKKLYLLLAIVSILAFTSPAHAVDVNTVNSMVDQFKNAATSWEGPLLTIATDLFWLLATIQFTWAMIGLAFRTNDFGTWLSTIFNQIIFICFFYWLLINSSSFAKAIVDSFRNAASSASGTSLLKPSDFFVEGLKIVEKIFNSISAWSPMDSLGMLIAAIIIMICFALICAFLVLALVEMYIVVSASVLLMGFGGSQWTKDYAIRTLQYAVSVGAKIFVLQLIAGIGLVLINDWTASLDVNKNIDLVGIIGCSVILLALTKIIPEMVQGIINGTSIGSGGALTSSLATVTGAAAGAAIATAGQSAAVSSSFKLASEQLKSSGANGGTNGSTPGGKSGSVLGLIGQAGKNYAGGLAGDLGGRLTGKTSSHSTAGTSIGGRMASSMNAQKDSLKSKREASDSGDNKQPQSDKDNTIS